MSKELSAVETCCFNCKLKDICVLIKHLWHPDFKKNIGHATSPEKRTKFFEAVERMLAKVCEYFETDV